MLQQDVDSSDPAVLDAYKDHYVHTLCFACPLIAACITNSDAVEAAAEATVEAVAVGETVEEAEKEEVQEEEGAIGADSIDAVSAPATEVASSSAEGVVSSSAEEGVVSPSVEEGVSASAEEGVVSASAEEVYTSLLLTARAQRESAKHWEDGGGGGGGRAKSAKSGQRLYLIGSMVAGCAFTVLVLIMVVHARLQARAVQHELSVGGGGVLEGAQEARNRWICTERGQWPLHTAAAAAAATGAAADGDRGAETPLSAASMQHGVER
jgi:hypothetical protein